MKYQISAPRSSRVADRNVSTRAYVVKDGGKEPPAIVAFVEAIRCTRCAGVPPHDRCIVLNFDAVEDDRCAADSKQYREVVPDRGDVGGRPGCKCEREKDRQNVQLHALPDRLALFEKGARAFLEVLGVDESADFLNRGNIASWGNDQFWLFPNISIQIWARGYYITYTYWPETVDSHIYEIDLYFVPPANAADRLAQELVVDSTIEFAMQDVNTIEATHSALKTRAQNTFHLSDQELLIRQFHTVIRDTVGAYQSATSTREA